MEVDKNNRFNSLDLRLLAVGISLLVSFFIILNPGLPNDDAYTYIRIAEITLSDGVGAAIQYYPWAGYSLLIALISKLGVDLTMSAHLINAFFFSVLVYSFISIVNLVSNSRSATVLATICILLYPPLNELRGDIIRDIAMWALTLFALWQFLLFLQFYRLPNFLCFCLSLILASFFRPEAIVYLFSLPFSLLFDNGYPKKIQIKSFLTINAITFLCLALVILLVQFFGIDILAVSKEFLAIYEPFVNSTLNPSEAESSSLSSGIFGEYASSYSGPYLGVFLTAGLIAILIMKLIEGVGGPFFFLLIHGAIQRSIKLSSYFSAPLVIFLATNMVIVLGFIVTTKFVSSRYSMLFCIVLVLLVPIILDDLITNLQVMKKRTIGMRVLILFFGYCAFDSFISFGSSKEYITQSLVWLKSDDHSEAELITNNHAIAYYSGKVKNYDQVPRFVTEDQIHALRPSDLIAIEMHYEMLQLVEKESVKPYIELQVALPNIEDMALAIYKKVEPRN